MHHEPVMSGEVLSFVEEFFSENKPPDLKSKIKILDGTLGLGGYSEIFLEKIPESFVLGIDRDEQAINFSHERLSEYEKNSRFSTCLKNFGNLIEIPDINSFDVYVFDLGVSNMQLTVPERGFSFQNDGPLDMRMGLDREENSIPASEVLRIYGEKELAKIFRDYGEEKYANLIASAIKKSKTQIKTTFDLVNLIRETLPQPVQRKMGTHPARRVFQALRIFVNNETGELENLLKSLRKILSIKKEKAKNSLVIFVSYHSIEDRLIKINFREWQSENIGKILTKHPLTPSDEEISKNYKSRSAKLRAFVQKQI